MTTDKAFSRNLRRMIIERGYDTIKDFAVQNGFDYRNMYGYVRGDHFPRLDTAWYIAKALGVTLNDLMEGAT